MTGLFAQAFGLCYNLVDLVCFGFASFISFTKAIKVGIGN
jgi:hypothetical protein